MGFSPTPEQLYEYLQRLERMITEVSRTSMSSAVIVDGGLVVRGDGAVLMETASGVRMFYIGNLVGPDSNIFSGTVLRRGDNTPMFYTTTVPGDPTAFTFAWLDQNNNIAFADDNAGDGIRRPWLSVPVQNILGSSLPATSNAGYIGVQGTGQFLKQQPKIRVQALLISNGGGAGNARFTINGAPTGSVVPIAVGQFAYTAQQTLTLPGAISDFMRVEMELQLTNGVGTVGGSFNCTQRES